MIPTSRTIEIHLVRLALCLGLAAGTATAARAETAFEQLAASVKSDLDASLRELAELQKQIGTEKLPLTRQLREMENRVLERTREFDRESRSYENQLVGLNVLKSEVKARDDEFKFLTSLLTEYARVFETRVHISEVSRYAEQIEEAKTAGADVDLSPSVKLERQGRMLHAAIQRIQRLIGGDSFEGRALTPSGIVDTGTFTLIGPVAVFASGDGETAGLAELQLGSPETTVIDVGPRFAEGIRTVTSSGAGNIPLDATLGNALKINATKDSLLTHIRKGGPVMVPILLLGLSALVIAVFKWFQISRIRVAEPIELQAILTHLNNGAKSKAKSIAESITGPVGEMLTTAIQHVGEKKEYIEEVMYEKMLGTKPRLERLLPMIALSAATAPLLGLLGTVTGMINTFNMITAFGTGDPKTLAGGISEALVTTEFGLIVAVPSLLLHAFINRKAKSVIGSMEQTAVAFINGAPHPDGLNQSTVTRGKEETQYA